MSFISRRIIPVARLSIVRSFTSKTTKVVERELPKPPPPSKRRWLWTGIGVGAVVWAVGLGAALNHQRLSSSVVHGTLFMVRYDPRVIELVGDKVDYADKWPWISGTVNHLKGRINIGFVVAGSTGERARVHFKSRRTRHNWVTEEFSVTRLSDNKTVDIVHHALTETGEPIVQQ